jgi:hypothetical protein
VDVVKAFEALISTLWYLKLPCFDIKGLTGDQNGQKSMLKQCSWKGIIIPCSAIFTRVTTDQVDFYPKYNFILNCFLPELANY